MPRVYSHGRSQPLCPYRDRRTRRKLFNKLRCMRFPTQTLVAVHPSSLGACSVCPPQSYLVLASLPQRERFKRRAPRPTVIARDTVPGLFVESSRAIQAFSSLQPRRPLLSCGNGGSACALTFALRTGRVLSHLTSTMGRRRPVPTRELRQARLY